MAIIRQEINILDHIWANDASTGERAQLDTTKYSGTVTYYFETVGKVASGTLTLTLRREGTATDDATINITATSYTRQRVSFTPPAGQTVYVINGVNGTSPFVTSARIIVFQNAATISTTETQVEIGEYNDSTTSVSDVPMTNPKYWLYTAANWNGAIMFYFEAVIGATNTKSGGTATLQADNTSYGGWANVTNTALGPTTSTLPVRYRSAAFNIGVTGTHYRLVYKSGTSKSAVTVYGAKIIIDQGGLAWEDNFDKSNVTNWPLDNVNTGVSQSFTASFSGTLTNASFNLKKVGTPTGNIVYKLYAHSGTYGTSSIPTGTALATSDTFAVSGLTTSPVKTTINFSGGNQYALVSGTFYVITAEYTVGTAANNVVAMSPNFTGHSGNTASLAGSTWTSSGNDINFEVKATSTGVSTLIEPQYLLLNTGDIGTGAQSCFNFWDSSEWSSVTNVYKHAMDSDNASNAAKLTAVFVGDLTNSPVTGANQQISSSIDLASFGSTLSIDTNVTNSTGVVAASRILVAVTILTGIPNKILAILQAVNRTSTY